MTTGLNREPQLPQRPIRYQGRPPLQSEEHDEREVFAAVEQFTPLQLLRQLRRSVCRRPNKTGAHLFTINDEHTFSKTLLLTSDSRVHARRGGNPRLQRRRRSHRSSQQTWFPGISELKRVQSVPSMSSTRVPIISPVSPPSEATHTAITGRPGFGQLTVALNKVLGNHELKFGFEGRQHQMNYIQTNAPNGIFNFDHGGSSQCPTIFSTWRRRRHGDLHDGVCRWRRLLRNPGSAKPRKTTSTRGMCRRTGRSTPIDAEHRLRYDVPCPGPIASTVKTGWI